MHTTLILFLSSFLFSACCRNAVPPILDEPRVLEASVDEVLSYRLEDIVIDSALPIEELQLSVYASDENVEAVIEDAVLWVRPAEGFQGEADIFLDVVDACAQESSISFHVVFGHGVVEESECVQTFRYFPQETVAKMFVAGEFSDWQGVEMELQDDGSWRKDVVLAQGSYAYKFFDQLSSQGTSERWTCDPGGYWFQCDAGQSLGTECRLGEDSCNSIVVVEDCALPKIAINQVDISSDSLHLNLESIGGNSIESVRVTQNGEVSLLDWNSDLWLTLDQNFARQTIDIVGIDASGRESAVLHIPFWREDLDWDAAVMYFAFVDRFYNQDSENDGMFGSNWSTGDYLGGDIAGVIAKLDYLADMGVNVLWLTNPLDNPEGLFDGDCGMQITGYHGYWPVSNTEIEEHFATEETIQELVREAHDRGIRVLVDWVGNHTHIEHPWYQEHPEWYTEPNLCVDNDNWNQAPETCWFASYVPTLDYSKSSVLTQSIGDAIQFAKKYDLDGFRVDAVKHMPMAVHWNLQKQISKEIEHKNIGSSMEFYTVGETFSGDRNLLRAYMGEELLDGQFDFPLYWKILDVLARDQASIMDLEDAYQESAGVFTGQKMSLFLGNHDVERFISHAAGQVGSLYGDGLCPNGEWRGPAVAPDWDEPYQRLQLAWIWLFTHPGVGLVYYGDEIGLAGYHDPDNRQMMPWNWSQRQEMVQSTVSILANARQVYPQLTSENRVVWWEEWDVLAYAMIENGHYALVILNRSGDWRTLSNGLSWAGLPTNQRIRNILDDTSVDLNTDNFTTTLAPYSGQVWVWEP